MADPFLVPLHRIHVPENMPAGMDLCMIGLNAVPLRKTPMPITHPLLLRPCNCSHWEIADGRHRYVGGLVAGRFSLLANEEMIARPRVPIDG